MTRTTLATVALVGLLLLTGLTAWLAETAASPWMLAGAAMAKIAVIGLVFLELDRSRPVWAVAFLGMTAAIACGAAALLA